MKLSIRIRRSVGEGEEKMEKEEMEKMEVEMMEMEKKNCFHPLAFWIVIPEALEANKI